MKTKLINVWCILLMCSLFTLSCNKSSVTPGTVKLVPPVAPVVSGTVWGASSASFIGENFSGIASWQRLNNRLKAVNGGNGLMGRRSYDTGIPANFAASAMVEDVGNCEVSLGSFKPNWVETANGTNSNDIKQFVQSIPADRIVYLTFFHEPEDNVGGANTFDVLQRAFAKFVDIVLTSGRPNVHPCFVLMSWTFKSQSGRTPENYNMAKYLKAGQAKEVIAGMDGYADDPTVNATQTFETGLARMGTWGFTRFGIFETGDHASSIPSERSAWITGLGQYVNARKNIEVVSWFNNGNGQNAGPTGWYLGNWYKNGTTYTWDDVDGTLSAYAQLLKR